MLLLMEILFRYLNTDNGCAEELNDEDGRFAFADKRLNCVFSKG